MAEHIVLWLKILVLPCGFLQDEMRWNPEFYFQSETDCCRFASISGGRSERMSMYFLSDFISQVQPDFFFSDCCELEAKVIWFNNSKLLTDLKIFWKKKYIKPQIKKIVTFRKVICFTWLRHSCPVALWLSRTSITKSAFFVAFGWDTRHHIFYFVNQMWIEEILQWI